MKQSGFRRGEASAPIPTLFQLANFGPSEQHRILFVEEVRSARFRQLQAGAAHNPGHPARDTDDPADGKSSAIHGSGIGTIQAFDAHEYNCSIAGEVKEMCQGFPPPGIAV